MTTQRLHLLYLCYWLDSIHDDINFHFSTKGLKLFHLNIRSLHAKFDEVRDILLSCKKVDIFGFTETFLTDTDTTSYEIPGFTLITRNRTSGSGGGVCVYVRDGINFELREDLHCDNVEGIFIEIIEKIKTFHRSIYLQAS